MEDFFVKVVAQLLLNASVKLIEKVASSEYSQNVVDAIYARCRDRGAWSALSSSLRALLLALAPDVRRAAGFAYVAPLLVTYPVAPQVLGALFPRQSIVAFGIEVLLLLQLGSLAAAFCWRLVWHMHFRGHERTTRLMLLAAAGTIAYILWYVTRVLVASFATAHPHSILTSQEVQVGAVIWAVNGIVSVLAFRSKRYKGLHRFDDVADEWFARRERLLASPDA
jgi:hypothetical protein